MVSYDGDIQHVPPVISATMEAITFDRCPDSLAFYISCAKTGVCHLQLMFLYNSVALKHSASNTVLLFLYIINVIIMICLCIFYQFQDHSLINSSIVVVHTCKLLLTFCTEFDCFLSVLQFTKQLSFSCEFFKQSVSSSHFFISNFCRHQFPVGLNVIRLQQSKNVVQHQTLVNKLSNLVFHIR